MAAIRLHFAIRYAAKSRQATMPTPATHPDPRGYLPALTGLRAFAALLVLVLHANQNFSNALSNNLLFVHRGYLGVDLFFVLSGFIIAHVYMRQIVPLRAKALRFFLWHRFVRLFPAHAAVLIGLIALILVVQRLGIPLNSKDGWDFHDLPWHFLLLHAWGVTETASWNAPSWSISAEWFAYLLFPAVAFGALALPRRTALPLAVVTIVLTAIVFDLAGWDVGAAWVGLPALARVGGEFTCGVFLYRAANLDGIQWLTRGAADLVTFGGLLGFLAGASLRAHDFVLIASLAVFILGVSAAGPLTRSIFARGPVVWLGEISYSIYIVHFPVLLVLRHGAERIFAAHLAAMPLVAFLVSVAIVIAAAAILFYAVENPARRGLRNVFGKIEPVPVTSAPMPADNAIADRIRVR
ncbi:MAG: acyltransferase [Xanthobacteraceae bacterium]